MIFEVFPPAEELQENAKNVQCSQEGCTKTFLHKGALNMHLIKSHGLVKTTQDRLLYSSIKGKKMADNFSFQYYCPADQCIYKKHSNRFFTSFKLLKQHYQKVHAEKIYKCERCPLAFGLERELRRHADHCGVLFKCGSCPVKYTTKETLQSHCNRKEHVFPEEYSSKNGNKNKTRAKKTTPNTSVLDPKSVPVAVLVLGLPPPPTEHPKLPKAILPKGIHCTGQRMKTEQTKPVESPGKETEMPVRQHAVIQTEIYGVENLAVEGRENLHDLVGSGSDMDRSLANPSHGISRTKSKIDKINSYIVRKKKSSTGMQTSVSLFSKKRLKTVTGTQTSGDYILKKAMACADIPIQRKTVASQVTPQKDSDKLARKRTTCTSETQTGISPEKKSKGDVDSTNSPVIPISQISDNMDMTDSWGDPLSTSTQTLQSFMESLKTNKLEVSIASSSILSLSSTGDLIISPSKPCNIQNNLSSNSDMENIDVSRKQHNVTLRSEPSNSLASNSNYKTFQEPYIAFSENLTPVLTESSKHTDEQGVVTDVNMNVSPETNIVMNTINNNGSSSQITSTSTIIHNVNHEQEITDGAQSKTVKKSAAATKLGGKMVNPKGRKTIRNLLDESAKKKAPLSKPLPVISTTSGITYSSNIITNSRPQILQTVPTKAILPTSSAFHGKNTVSDYDSHKLFNPVQDQMFGGSRTNESSNRTDMEAQAMSASEFEQLLAASGLLLEVKSQTDNGLSGMGYHSQTSGLSLQTGNQTVDLAHKEILTETLTDPDFDFLNENASTIDMNTQTITDFGNLLGESYGPMDSDTQTVTDFDFLDLVMTNMETQTLSDQDLIDLGLMDPDQAPLKPFDAEIDYLKSSETQTSLVSLVESSTHQESSKGNSIEDKLTDDKLSPVYKTTFAGDNTNAMKSNLGSNLDVNTKAVNTTKSQNATESAEDFHTTNMETQTAFDESER